jgi:hypothetical protein
MKRLIVIYTLLLPVHFACGQVFIGTEPTGNPVLLEVKSNNRGVLIPRMNIPDTLAASPVINPKEGLFVMNTHSGKEGLFFWNGQAWEKLKIAESVAADLRQTGKQSIFIGTEKTEQRLTAHTFSNIRLKAFWGALTNSNDTRTAIPADGIYEVTSSFTGIASKADGFIILNIYNYTQQRNLAYNTESQSHNYKDIGSKAIYYGPLKKGDEIGIRIFYGTNDTNSAKVETLKMAILSIKKINTN